MISPSESDTKANRASWARRLIQARVRIAGLFSVVALAKAPLLLSTFLLVSCTSRSVRVEGLMISYASIKTIVSNNIPGGVRSQSSNGRQIISGYFSPQNLDDDATDKRERAYTEITILGAGRPYKLDIKAFRERKDRDSDRYKRLGEDENLAKDVTKRIQHALADRREDRNVIDDFRAF